MDWQSIKEDHLAELVHHSKIPQPYFPWEGMFFELAEKYQFRLPSHYGIVHTECPGSYFEWHSRSGDCFQLITLHFEENISLFFYDDSDKQKISDHVEFSSFGHILVECLKSLLVENKGE